MSVVCWEAVVLAAVVSMAVAVPARSEPSAGTRMRLWAGAAPGALGTEEADIPDMAVYLAERGRRDGSAIVVCPGGGYGGLAHHEGEPVAQWLNTLGISAVVLKYRLGPTYHHPVMLEDVARALRLVRFHAPEWRIDPARVGVLGFSAGGHLASTIETHFDAGDQRAPDPVDRLSSRPAIGVLVYPVITMGEYTHAGSRANLLGPNPSPELIHLLSNETQVTHETPPTFLVTSAEDTAVPCENSLNFALALHRSRVPFELHCYEKGPHGFGLALYDPVLSQWTHSCALWLRLHQFGRE